MRLTFVVLGTSVLLLGGCAALDAFLASPEGSGAVDAVGGAASMAAAFLLPPPFGSIAASAIGGLIGLLLKKGDSE